MILVDTSAWIEMLRATGSPIDTELRRLIAADAPVILNPIVLSELLRGKDDPDEAAKMAGYLLAFPILEQLVPDDYVLAASLHRMARRSGITIRGIVDCLIAAPCVRRGIPLLHADADFDRLASCTELQLYPAG